MYARFVTLLPVAALAAAVAAAPSGLEARWDTPSNCNTGPIQCCQSMEESSPTTLSSLSGLLGIALPNVEGLIGLNCDPITVIGTGSGSACTGQTACCTNNQFNGLVNLGCSPININL